MHTVPRPSHVRRSQPPFGQQTHPQLQTRPMARHAMPCLQPCQRHTGDMPVTKCTYLYARPMGAMRMTDPLPHVSLPDVRHVARPLYRARSLLR